MKPSNAKKGAPPRYDDAFKEGAVKLVTEQEGRLAADVAKELGVSADSLRTWLRMAGVMPAAVDRSNKDAKRIRELEAQVRELKKQTAEKDEVIAVLKKSVGILSIP